MQRRCQASGRGRASNHGSGLGSYVPLQARLNGVNANRSLAFPRARRIVKTDEFSSVFSLRPAFRTAHFVLYVRPSTLPDARLGVVAAKRLAPRAVTRNTVKRMTRELFRQAGLPAIDCIVRLSRPVNTKAGPATNASLRRLLKAELGQLFNGQWLGRLPAALAQSSTSQDTHG